MKKFLSLVLALVMTMSLVTVSAGAKDFTDDSTITYKEAVDVVSALKIVDGYTDGSFNPNATLTRGAAAKIICNLILGTTTASALAADAAPFSDVPANHTFAGYIAYCSKMGIISGYADGTFRPAASLTGYAFMKMLLGALGYDSAIEGYTGANWSIAVAKQAVSIGLDDGNDDFFGTQPVTREEACLYAFNTLKADIVKYDNSLIVNNGTVGTVSKVESVPQGTSGIADKLGGTYTANVQFCEKYFPKLARTTPGTAFDEPSTTWRLDGVKIGDYASSPKLTYTTKVKMETIYADLGLDANAASTLYYVNGEDLTGATGVAVTARNTTRVGGQGTITTVYKTTSTTGAVTVRIVEKQQFIAKITSIDEATATTKRTVNLVGKGTGSASTVKTGTQLANSFETEDFARGDYVYFTASQDNDLTYYTVRSLAKAEKVTGELTAYTANSSVVVGGTTYNVGAVGFGGQAYVTNGGQLKDTVDLYLDGNGNVLLIETSEAADDVYAFVLAATGDGSSFDPYKAQIQLLDGTKKIVETKDNAAAQVNEFVSYRVNSDDKYVLTTDGTMNHASSGVTVNNGKSPVAVSGGNTYYANDATIFLVKTVSGASTTTNVYTGYKNVPSVSGGSIVDVVCKTGNVANYVYIDATSATISGGTSNVLFILGSSIAERTQDSDSDYYTFKCVDNGVIGTVKLDANDALVSTLTASGDNAVIVTGKYTDKYGVMTINNNVANTATGIGEVTKSTISFGWNSGAQDFNTTLAVDSKCEVYVVGTDGVITASDVDAVSHDTNDVVFYSTVDNLGGIVDNIFIVKK